MQQGLLRRDTYWIPTYLGYFFNFLCACEMIFVSTSPLEPRSRSLIRVYFSALILSLVKWNNEFDFQLKFKYYFDIVLWKRNSNLKKLYFNLIQNCK